MKSLVKNYVIVILLLGTAINLPSCSKEESLPTPPVVATTNVSDITETTALIQGIIKDDGGDDIIAKGICWSTFRNPTISSDRTTDVSGNSSFTGILTGLKANTKYYVRAYATNSAGTSYGNEFTFITNDLTIKKSTSIIFNPDLSYSSVADIDGNSYKTVQIGGQVWMAENLKVTRLNDGTPIRNVIYGVEWVNTPAYSWYNNNASVYAADYGALYNWIAVYTGKLCPSGWHVPADYEWGVLTAYLGGFSNAVSNLIETGNLHWLNPDTGATNSSGFSGLPGGFRFADYDDIIGYFDYFTDLGYSSYWWLNADAGDPDYALAASINSRENFSPAGLALLRKKDHLSVRCVKNN